MRNIIKLLFLSSLVISIFAYQECDTEVDCLNKSLKEVKKVKKEYEELKKLFTTTSPIEIQNNTQKEMCCLGELLPTLEKDLISTVSNSKSEIKVLLSCNKGGLRTDLTEEYFSIIKFIDQNNEKIDVYYKINYTSLSLGFIIIEVDLKKSSIYNIGIVVNNFSPLYVQIIVSPLKPSIFNIVDLPNVLIKSKEYNLPIIIIDQNRNHIVFDHPLLCFSYNFPYVVSSKYDYFEYLELKVDQVKRELILIFKIRSDYDERTIDFSFLELKHMISLEIISITNAYSIINDVEIKVVSSFDAEKTNIKLVNKNFKINVVDFSNLVLPVSDEQYDIYVIMKKDFGCSENKEIDIVDISFDTTIGIISGRVPEEVFLKCLNYYYINIYDRENEGNIEFVIQVTSEDEKDTKEKFKNLVDYEKIINDKTLTEDDTYIINTYEKKEVVIFDLPKVSSDEKKLEAGLFFILHRIFLFGNTRILNLTRQGIFKFYDLVFVINNYYDIIELNKTTTEEFQEFYKVEVILSKDVHSTTTIEFYIHTSGKYILYTDEIISTDKMHNENIQYLTIIENKPKIINVKYTYFEIILHEIINYKNFDIMKDNYFNDHKLLIETITQDNVKRNLGNDIYNKYDDYVAFRKERFVNVENTSETKAWEYIFSGIYFTCSKVFIDTHEFLFVDSRSINVVYLFGDVQILTPQGIYKNFTLNNDKVYEAIIYVIVKETQEVISLKLYFYYSSFNLVFSTPHSKVIINGDDGGKGDEKDLNIMKLSDLLKKLIEKISEELNKKYEVLRKAKEEKGQNPSGSEYDLCRDNSVKGIEIMIANFVTVTTDVFDYVRKKGFKVTIFNDHNTFYEELKLNKEYSIIWIISNKIKNEAIGAKLFEYVKKGTSLFLMGDNDPYYLDINVFLNQYYGNNTYQLQGNIPGTVTLYPGNGKDIGTFNKDHLLSKGLVSLYEGVTVCTWNTQFPDFEIFAKLKEQDSPLIWYKDKYNKGKGEGRILIDCGFTKIMSDFINDEVRRYIANAACWLSYLENDPNVSN